MNRNDLDAKFKMIVPHVYFQPPESVKLSYPCIVYQLDDHSEFHADDTTYLRMRRYSVTYITKNPDDLNVETIADMKYCRLNRFFTNDNLNHYVYTIYH